jgi:hypothetical protein
LVWPRLGGGGTPDHPASVAIEPSSNPVIGADSAESLSAILRDGSGSPITERTVLFVVEGGATALVQPVITDYAGRASLGNLALGTGSYTVTAHFATVVDQLPGSLATVTSPTRGISRPAPPPA